jgi:tetratricopeptide (TPR) repeat protein
MNHERLRRVECTRSWRQVADAAREPLAKKKKWDATVWACQVASFDVLGDFVALQKSLLDHDADIERSGVEVRSYRLYTVGRMRQALGEYDLALAAYMRALAMGPSVEIRALTLLQTSTINVFLDAHEEALSNLLSVRDEALARGDYFSAAHAADFLADRALRTKALDLARIHAADARKWAGRVHNRYRLDWVLALEGQIEFASGNLAEGLDRLRRAQAAFAKTGAHGSEMHCAVRLGEAFLEADRLDEASTVLKRATELAATHRYNVSRIKLLRLNALLKKRTGELEDDVFTQAMRRADVLAARNRKAWSSIYSRGRVYSVNDVDDFLTTLDWSLFEIICREILEFEGYRCTMAPLGEMYIDMIAEKMDTTSGKLLRWGVSCKRLERKSAFKVADVPDVTVLETVGCDALMLMTTGAISGHSARKIKALTGHLPVDTWERVRITKYLAEHDWILADVGTQLPDLATFPRRPARS